MKKYIFFSILTLSLLLSISFNHGQAQTVFGFGGGITAITSDGSELYNMGFNGCGEAFLKFSKNIQFGGRIVYNRIGVNEDELKDQVLFDLPEFSGFNLDYSGSYASIIELLPTIRLTTSSNDNQKTQFFGQLGAGLYMIKLKVKASVSDRAYSESAQESKSDNKFGINFGAGIIVGASGNIRFALYPMYNIYFVEGKSTKYFAVNVAILFGT